MWVVRNLLLSDSTPIICSHGAHCTVELSSSHREEPSIREVCFPTGLSLISWHVAELMITVFGLDPFRWVSTAQGP